MKRQQVIEEVRRALGGTATAGAAELALDAVLRSIQEGLRREGEVKIAGFGSFRVHESAGRMVKHPKTGELCAVLAQRVVKFRPSPQQQSWTSSPNSATRP